MTIVTFKLANFEGGGGRGGGETQDHKNILGSRNNFSTSTIIDAYSVIT